MRSGAAIGPNSPHFPKLSAVEKWLLENSLACLYMRFRVFLCILVLSAAIAAVAAEGGGPRCTDLFLYGAGDHDGEVNKSFFLIQNKRRLSLTTSVEDLLKIFKA